MTHDIDEAAYLANRIVVLSASPRRAKETITVDLPRPRDQIATKELPEFAHLRARVFRVDQGREQPPAGRDLTGGARRTTSQDHDQGGNLCRSNGEQFWACSCRSR